MANEFIIKNGFRSKGDSQVTGSLGINGDIEIAGFDPFVEGIIPTGDGFSRPLHIKSTIPVTSSFTSDYYTLQLSAAPTYYGKNVPGTSVLIEGGPSLQTSTASGSKGGSVLIQSGKSFATQSYTPGDVTLDATSKDPSDIPVFGNVNLKGEEIKIFDGSLIFQNTDTQTLSDTKNRISTITSVGSGTTFNSLLIKPGDSTSGTGGIGAHLGIEGGDATANSGGAGGNIYMNGGYSGGGTKSSDSGSLLLKGGLINLNTTNTPWTSPGPVISESISLISAGNIHLSASGTTGNGEAGSIFLSTSQNYSRQLGSLGVAISQNTPITFYQQNQNPYQSITNNIYKSIYHDGTNLQIGAIEYITSGGTQKGIEFWSEKKACFGIGAHNNTTGKATLFGMGGSTFDTQIIATSGSFKYLTGQSPLKIDVGTDNTSSLEIVSNNFTLDTTGNVTATNGILTMNKTTVSEITTTKVKSGTTGGDVLEIESSNLSLDTEGKLSSTELSATTGSLSLLKGNSDLIIDNGGDNIKIVSANFNVTDAGEVSSGGSDGVSTTSITASSDISSSGTITANSLVKGGGTSAQFLKADGSVDSSTYSTATGVENNADVTDATSVTAAGALMDSELTNESAVKGINQALTTTSNVDFNNVEVAQLTEDNITIAGTNGRLSGTTDFTYNVSNKLLSAPTASFDHLIVSQVISSSVINTSGSNIFGDESTDTQTLNGSVILGNITSATETDALFINGSNTIKKRTLQANAFTSTTIPVIASTSVTDLNDVTSAGSGIIITAAERTAIGTNTTDISTNTSDISTNTSDISTNTTNISGKLAKASNLSDLNNATTARTNIGLGNVDNKSSSTIRGEITSTNVTSALGFTPTSNTGTLTGNGATYRVPIYNGTTSFTTDSGFTYSSNILSTEKLNITAIAATTTENTTIMINGDGETLTRELGSNAFNSTAFLTSLSGAVLTSGDQTASGTKTFSGTVKISNAVNAGFDTNKFLVLDTADRVDFRTGAEVRGDIDAAAKGANSDITSLTGLTTALSVAQGGTGATTLGAFLMAANDLSELNDPQTARDNLELGGMSVQDNTNVNIDGGSITGITDLLVVDGGTGASNASTARSNLGAAKNGANTDITSIINGSLTTIGSSNSENAENYINFGDDKIALTQGSNLAILAGADFRPNANNSMNLGNSTYMWADAYSRQFISDASTTAIPAFVIDKDSPTTGFYSSGQNQIGITINNSQIGYFNANGIQLNSGIGTSTIGGHLQAHCLGIGTSPSTTSGEIRAAGDVVANYSSDKRLKENIKPISGALDKLLQISGVTFNWIEKEEVHSHKGHDVGVIAQEVEEVLPEVVVTRDNGYKAVNYEKIVPLLIESIKDLKAEIDELKKSK